MDSKKVLHCPTCFTEWGANPDNFLEIPIDFELTCLNCNSFLELSEKRVTRACDYDVVEYGGSMQIRYLKFILSPEEHSPSDDFRSIKISIQTDRGIQHNFRKTIPVDDLLSFYDQLFAELKERLLEHIKREESQKK